MSTDRPSTHDHEGDDEGFTDDELDVFRRIAEDAEDERVQRIGEILLQSNSGAKVVDNS